MRPIKLTQLSLAKAKEAILSQLDGLRLQNTKINLQYDFIDAFKEQLKEANYKRPIIYMTAGTYLKMQEYVKQCDVEIAWHGTVKRGTDDKKHLFYIKDVFLYPQKIASATVQVDDTKYTQWTEKLDIDTFNNMRFQGHSHVNMGTFYSSTDEENKRAFLNDLLDDDFYIFLVTNKRGEHNFEIYDLAQNIIFEKNDIDFRVYLNENDNLSMVKSEIEEYCTKQTYTPFNNAYQEDLKERIIHGPGFLDERFKNQQTPSYSRNPIKIKRNVILLDLPNRDLIEENPTLLGDSMNIRFNGKNYEVFVPYKPLTPFEIENLRKSGWHVREMPVPEDLVI